MNKGMFGFPERFRDGSFYGFPKKKVSGESFFGFPSGSEEYDLKVFIPQTSVGVQKNLYLVSRTPNKQVIIDWGDGTIEPYTMTTISGLVKPHTYTQTGYYNVNIYGDTDYIAEYGSNSAGWINKISRNGDKFSGIEKLLLWNIGIVNSNLPNISTWTKLKYFNISLNSFTDPLPDFSHCLDLIDVNAEATLPFAEIKSFENCTQLVTFNITTANGELPSFNACINLISFRLGNSKCTGILPSFSNCIKLQTFIVNQVGFSGTLPSFSTNVALVDFQIQNNQFTGTLPSFNNLTNLVTFNCSNNQFSGNIPTFSGCTSLQNFTAGGSLNAWTGTVPYFPASLKVFVFSDASSATLEFPYDIFDNLINLTTINIRQLRIGGAKTFPNLSNNINLGTLYITDNQNTETKFNNGTVTFNTPKLVWFYSRNMDGVSLDFTNLQMLNTSSYFTFSSASGGNVVYPLGSKIIGTNGMEISLFDNGMSQANVDATIVNLFSGRNNFINTATPKGMNIAGSGTFGTANSAPSGTYQQPAGFTHNLTEGEIDTLSASWSVKEKIWVLVNCQVSSVDTTKRYKWTITTN